MSECWKGRGKKSVSPTTDRINKAPLNLWKFSKVSKEISNFSNFVLHNFYLSVKSAISPLIKR